MTALQFALFFAALVIGFVVVFLRVTRTGQLLKELLRLADIEERLADIESAVRESRPASEITEMLSEIREELATVAARLERPVMLPTPEAPKAEGIEPSPAELLRDRIESRLYSMGYQQVKILTDLKDVGSLEACKVTIECQKDEIVHKGSVTMQNGSILEMRLLPALQVFP